MSVIKLDTEQWDEFVQLLDAPPFPMPKLEKALTTKTVFQDS